MCWCNGVSVAQIDESITAGSANWGAPHGTRGRVLPAPAVPTMWVGGFFARRSPVGQVP